MKTIQSSSSPQTSDKVTPAIRLGVCPAHFKFADVLAPDENGHLPRHPDGQLKVLTESIERIPNS